MSDDSSRSPKKVRRGSRGKASRGKQHQDAALCKNKQDMMSSPVGTSIEDDTLLLDELFSTNVTIVEDSKSKVDYKQNPKRTLLCENQQQTRSSSSGYDTDVPQSSETNILRTSLSCKALVHSIKHDSSQDENESTEEEIERNISRTTSSMTDYSDIDISSSKDINVTINKCDVRSKSNKARKATLTRAVVSKRKVKSGKIKQDDLLQLQKNNVIAKQAHTLDKSLKKHERTPTVSATKLMKEDTRRDYSRTGESDKTNKLKNTQKTKQSQETKNVFPDHIPLAKMKRILENQTPDNIQYVTGYLRINPKYNNYAYLSIKDDERDLLINGTIDRNRAFDGDLVVALINPVENWQNVANELQKTGTIVCILEEIHPRKAIGYLVQHGQKNKSFVVIQPKDLRVPFIRIPSKSLPPSYHNQPESYTNMIFFVNINSWTRPNYATGEIIQIVGGTDDITAELTAVLFENNLDVSSYRKELLKELPDANYVITDADMRNREDWRNVCIFTIDPITAADLDDAISCRVLENGNYEVGVHISDVTHYLKSFSPLDKEVSKRATTIYLPHTSYHMLPKQLGQICSLLPGKDKLAFSVIWEITPNAEVVKHRFAKTVVKSCCQMSYDVAQLMIEKAALPENALDIKGDCTESIISDTVKHLFKLATIMRDRRFANGALGLNQIKLQICLDPKMMEYGIYVPVNYQLEELKDSNKLIEEFMLLANMTVAAHLYDKIPDTALLRVHKEPSKRHLSKTRDMLQKYGVHLDIKTAGTLFASIKRYEDQLECNSSTNNNTSQYVMMAIMNVCSKTMARAEYKCISTILSDNELRHYALNVPFYTHFTSPIRRYSDCVVHRLLFATMRNKPMPEQWTAELCSRIANTCNAKKYSAKLAQEQSVELFFTHMVGLAGGFEALAVVLEVKEHCMDVILCDTGIKLKIYYNDIKHNDTNVAHSKYSSISTLTVEWKAPIAVQEINMFSLVRVKVEKVSKKFRLKANLLHP